MAGLIHIYCGDGKGKTTAATGLAIRAAGSGMKVLFARFLKTEHSSELKILDEIENIEVIHMEKSYGFYKTLTEKEKEEVLIKYRGLWDMVVKKITRGEYQMLVLDEMMAAYNYGILKEKSVITVLKNKPKEMEIVMTGRNPKAELIELADYVSEIQSIKHPFQKGIAARKGVEY